jgi:hypothetical protein
MMEDLNHPFDQVTAKAEQLVQQGALVFQKFSCEKCGSRQTIDEPNTFFTKGSCEVCGHITDIRATGCNFLLIWSNREGHNAQTPSH